MGELISVNLAVPRHNPAKDTGVTGIDKHPTTEPVLVRAPGPKGPGLVGDQIFDVAHHGGDDQAVYAYAREDLDFWEAELGRPLTGGVFGENITTRGLDVTGALIGERWRVGEHVVLEVSSPRLPCGTFAHWMDEQGWIKRFTQVARPGAYFRVITPGAIRVGDPVVVEHRPDHEVTIGVTFRAVTLEPDLLPLLPPVEALPKAMRERAARRSAKKT
ncbi:MOSC domain-containing protein [Sphaerisporangium sp. B11E5]|uniref:MOSC domain-containing protein n=1 Tax=Sphaerisporangium sp. B11E5 TaxID=3153563 RepID=UPI00325C79BA